MGVVSPPGCRGGDELAHLIKVRRVGLGGQVNISAAIFPAEESDKVNTTLPTQQPGIPREV